MYIRILENDSRRSTIIPDNVFQDWSETNTLIDHLVDMEPIIDTKNKIIYLEDWVDGRCFISTIPLNIDELKHD